MSKQQKKVLESYKFFNTDKGKEVLRDLTKEVGLFSPSNNLDSQQLAYREGKRAVLFAICTLSKIKPSDLNRMFLDKQGEEDE